MTRCALDAIVEFYSHLSPSRLADLDQLYAADARFKDPFNEVQGVAAIRRIFEHMYTQVGAPRFEIQTTVFEGQQAMLVWVFRFQAGTRAMTVRGATHLTFDQDGKVSLHRDYWDAAEELYGKFPVLGGLMRLLARRLSAS